MIESVKFTFDNGETVDVLPPRAAAIARIYKADGAGFDAFESGENLIKVVKNHRDCAVLIVGEALREAGREIQEITGGELIHLLLCCHIAMMRDWGAEMVKSRLGAAMSETVLRKTDAPQP